MSAAPGRPSLVWVGGSHLTRWYDRRSDTSICQPRTCGTIEPAKDHRPGDQSGGFRSQCAGPSSRKGNAGDRFANARRQTTWSLQRGSLPGERRHVQRVPWLRPEAAAVGGDQGARRGRGRAARLRRALSPGGVADRQPAPSAYRPYLRLRPAGRVHLHGAGAAAGADAGAATARPGYAWRADGAPGDPGDRGAAGRRARRGPRCRHHPPRCQAIERHVERRWHAGADRLRDREEHADRGRPDPGGRGDRHAELPVARASPGPAVDPGQRHLRPRRGGLRNDRRPSAVHRRHDARGIRSRPYPAAVATPGAPRATARCRGGGAACAGQGPGGAFPQRRRASARA